MPSFYEMREQGYTAFDPSKEAKAWKSYGVRYQPVGASGPDWSQADLLTDFSSPWAPGHESRTEFRALWDERKLHFRFDAWDDTPILGQGTSLRQRVLESDRVEIFLTTDLSLSPYYCLEMAPSGESLVYRASYYRQIDWDWVLPGLAVSGQMNARGYTVHGSLPMPVLRDLGILHSDSKKILAGLFRADFCQTEGGDIVRTWLPWVPPGTERPDFHVPTAFGVLELVA